MPVGHHVVLYHASHYVQNNILPRGHVLQPFLGIILCQSGNSIRLAWGACSAFSISIFFICFPVFIINIHIFPVFIIWSFVKIHTPIPINHCPHNNLPSVDKKKIYINICPLVQTNGKWNHDPSWDWSGTHWISHIFTEYESFSWSLTTLAERVAMLSSFQSYDSTSLSTKLVDSTFFSVSFLPIYYDHIVLSVNSCDTYSFLPFPLHKCELWRFNYPASGQSVVPWTRWGISMGLLHNTRKICIWRPWNWSSIRWTWKFIHPTSNYKRARTSRIMYLDIVIKRIRSTVKRTPDLVPQFLINFVCSKKRLKEPFFWHFNATLLHKIRN